MDDGRKTLDSTIGPRELLIASLIVATGLVVFAFAYWGGRDLGRMLFS